MAGKHGDLTVVVGAFVVNILIYGDAERAPTLRGQIDAHDAAQPLSYRVLDPP
jgi:hypothetical protein